jgi:hypothetical protein
MNEAEASAPKDRWSSIDRLRAAVAGLDAAMDAYAAAIPPADSEALGAVRQAQHQLEEAIHAIQQPPGSQTVQPAN